MIRLAIDVAVTAHKGQIRKGTDIPYITHPLRVAVILQQAGASKDEVIAGILHDTIEDTDITLDYLINTFGKKIASIVQGCSEPDKSLSWEARKKHTLDYLKTAPLQVKTVACADKLDNLSSTIAEYDLVGDEIWKKFNRGKEPQKWYFQGLSDSFYDPVLIKKDIPFSRIYNLFRPKVENFFSKQ